MAGISPSPGKYNPYMKTRTLRNIRIILAAAIFLLATAAKLLLPERTEALRGRAREVISQDYDYRAAFRELGERLSGGRVMEALGRLGERPERAPEISAAPAALFEPTSISELRAIRSSLLPADYRLAAPVAAITEAAEPEPPEAVTAFLETQAAFTDEAIPADVCCDMPALPFEYDAPVSGYSSSGFGFRLHPLKNEIKFHYGTDFAVFSGTPVLAFADGKVSMVGWDGGYGNYIVLDHDGDWQTLYAHCGTIYVNCGENVTRGNRLALSGATGEVTGPHLHFELMCGGLYYNPEYWLA